MTVYKCSNCQEIFESGRDLDRHNTLEKIAAGQPISVSKDSAIIFKEIRMLSPALDCNPQHNVILTVPFVGIRTIEKQKGRSTTFEEQADTILCCITDSREIFEATQKNFLDRGWFAKIPQPILEPRWSMKTLSEFLFDGKESGLSFYDVFKMVREKFEYYVDFGSNTKGATVCAIYTILTYFYFLFEHCPYLKLGGEKGSGKSKTGSVFDALAFNAVMSANHTPATIYRLAQDTRGCMIIDEGEDLAFKSEEKAAYQQVILSGWQRNGFALRTDKDSMRPVKYSTYCPKIICSIGGLYDVLEDRAFEIILLKALSRDISDRQPVRTSPEWQPIRDAMYFLLMENWKVVMGLAETLKNTFDVRGRLWNLAKPLIGIAQLVDASSKGATNILNDVVGFIREQQQEKQSKAEASITFSILSCLQSILEVKNLDQDGNPNLERRVELSKLLELVRAKEGDQPNPVTGRYAISSKRISGTLANLKLYKDPYRDGDSGGYRFSISLSNLLEVKQRLSVTERPELPESTELPKQTPNQNTEAQSEHETELLSPSLGSSVRSEPSVSSVVSGNSSKVQYTSSGSSVPEGCHEKNIGGSVCIECGYCESLPAFFTSCNPKGIETMRGHLKMVHGVVQR
jgi:hypothetical protein